jgi:ABC-2 type transport system permease protein
MRTFGVLLRRELGAIFLSPIAWTAMTFFLAVMGASFWMLLELLARGAEGTEGGTVIGQLLGSIFFWLALLIVAPVITMRTLAEERRSGTFEMLMTAPVRDGAVVLAKYAAALLFYAALWLPTLAYPIALRLLRPLGAPMDVGALAAGYLGVMLIGAAALAAGVFASAVTRSQVTAALGGFAIVCVFFLAGFLPYIPHGETMSRAAHYASGVTHLLDFARGVVDTRPIAFYVINTAWLLWAAVQMVGARRWK